MSTPGDSREPASSPCRAPPGFWGEEEAPAEQKEEEQPEDPNVARAEAEPEPAGVSS